MILWQQFVIRFIKQNKGLDARRLRVTHIQANPASKQRRRTYRAHGRINRTYTYNTYVLVSCGDVLCFDDYPPNIGV